VPLVNRVIGVDPQPNEDGDNVIEVMLGDGNRFDAAIDLGTAQTLVEILQQRLVLWAHKSARNLRFPHYEIIDANVVHAGLEAQLTLTTSQIGAVGLRMSNDVLKKVQQEIGRVLTYRSRPRTQQ